MDTVENLAALCAALSGERVMLVMLPAGEATDEAIRQLADLASAGDTQIGRAHV